MYKKGITEIENMLTREHKAEGGMMGKEMEEKAPVKKKRHPMLETIANVYKIGSKIKDNLNKAMPNGRKGMIMKKGGGNCRVKKEAGGKNMALTKPEMLLNAKRTGFAAGSVGKTRKGEY